MVGEHPRLDRHEPQAPAHSGRVEVLAGGTSGNAGFTNSESVLRVGFWAGDRTGSVHSELRHFSSPCIGVLGCKRRGRVTDRRCIKQQFFDGHVTAPAAFVRALFPEYERESSPLLVEGGLGSPWSALGLDSDVV